MMIPLNAKECLPSDLKENVKIVVIIVDLLEFDEIGKRTYFVVEFKNNGIPKFRKTIFFSF